MEKKVVLTLSENSGFTLPRIETEELDTVISVVANNRKKALKKVVKLCRGHDILICKKSDGAELFNDTKRKWDFFSPELIVPVINKVCRQVSLKYLCSIPFEEIYIVAEQSFALRIIEQIKELARLFIVVSSKEADTKLYDKLYFEHCAMVRQTETMPKSIKDDSMIISFEEFSFSREYKSPFINFTNIKTNLYGEVDGRKICVSDPTIRQAEELWGGKSGFTMFELVGVKTTCESTVDINNCADDIFLLDMARF